MINYLDIRFMNILEYDVNLFLHEKTHVCGFCANYNPLDGRDDYGKCKQTKETVGFDCYIGRNCVKFERSKKIDFNLKVVSE